MTFTDPTDATGEDFQDRGQDYGFEGPAEPVDESPELRRTGS